LAALVVFFLVWGVLVEVRAAFLRRRMTDACCFFRAAWMVRTGGPLYDFTEENGWHYLYPPLLAILLVPLADAPPGVARDGLLPYPVSVAIWYIVSIFFLILAVHVLAAALEQAHAPGGRPPAGCRRWWALRILPLLFCLPPVAHTLMRGQTNLLLLALLCGAGAAFVRQRSGWAGLCLAGAICLKIYPAFLSLFFLWRRDFRALGACAGGLVLGLGLIPLAVFGPARTAAYYQQQARTLLGPALGWGQDRTLGEEILDSTNNDSQSLESALHNTLHLERSRRPRQPSALVRWAARSLALLLTLLTLLAAGGQRRQDPAGEVLFFGALTVVMLLACPICHTHYLCLTLPLIMAFLARRYPPDTDLHLSWSDSCLLALLPTAYILCNWPGLEVLRDLALTLYPTLFLWLAAVLLLHRRVRSTALPAAGMP
jgi:hypothetical protein